MNSIFLVGCPRSGTTLLQSMVASNKNVISFPETHFFSATLPINPILRRLKWYGPKEISTIKEFLLSHGYGELLNKDDFLKGRFTHRSWCHQLMNLLHEMAEKDSSQLDHPPSSWLEKTPRHLHYISSIQSAGSNPKFLHILREGKHVVASMYLATKNHPKEWKGQRSVKECISWWKKDISVSMIFADDPNHLIVVYEQLISAPEKVLRKVCKFLEIKYEQEMLTDFHHTADTITTENEHWKNRNQKRNLSPGNKLKEQFKDKTIRYISRETRYVNLSDFYL